MYQASTATNVPLENTAYVTNQPIGSSKDYEPSCHETSQYQHQQLSPDQYKAYQDTSPESNHRLIGDDESISLALDEIGAIINSKDFQEPFDIKQENPHECFQYHASPYTQHPPLGSSDNRQAIKQVYLEGEEQQKNLYHNYQPLKKDDEPANVIVGPYLEEQTKGDCYIDTSNTFVANNQESMAAHNTNLTADDKNNYPSNAYTNDAANKSKPYVEIVEQPARCALRFRYKCEGRSAGSLPGIHTTADMRTYPAIRIANYVGRAVIVVSCVTKDAPFRTHPHNIVGKEGCKKGICTIVVNNEPNMVFIQGSTPGKCDTPLPPVVSEPIHDKKAMSDLVITKLSHCSAPATGGREVILLCDRISRDDIQIRFYEERDGKIIWETYIELAPTDVHKQYAICFKTPKYYNENIQQPVMVRIQLKRVSDNQVSEPRLFQFLPCESDEDIISRKRQKIEWVNMNHYALDDILQPSSHHQHQQPPHLNQQRAQKPQTCTLFIQPQASGQVHQYDTTPRPS